MILAISSQGEGLDSLVDPRFGRAQGFVIVNADNGEHSYIANEQNLNLPQGAGIQSAMNVAKTGAKAVITGHVGPKAYAALNKGGVAIYLREGGTVAEAVEAFKSGQLTETDGADKPGHW